MSNTLVPYYNVLTKDELKMILNFFEVPYARTAKKTELVTCVSEFISSEPEKWLGVLSERDLRILQKLAFDGPMVWSTLDMPEYPTALEPLGLVLVDDFSGEEVKVALQEDMWNLIKDHVNDVCNEKEADGSFEVDRMALGMLNIYGVLPIKDFIDLVLDTFSDYDGERDIPMAIANSYVVAMQRYWHEGESYLVSPFVVDHEAIIMNREDFQEMKEYARFTAEEVISAGMKAPFCAYGLGSEEVENVMDILLKLGYTGAQAGRIMHEIWVNAQYSMEESFAEAMFKCINDRIDDIESFAEYRSYINAIAEYANKMPKWVLKGNISDEVNLLRLSIKVDESAMDGSNIPDEDEETEEMPDSSLVAGPTPMDQFYRFGLAVKPVYPDAPCPCGSGLSYCRCHGKILN